MGTIVLESSDNMTFTVDEKVAALSPKIQDLRKNLPKGAPVVINDIRGEILCKVIALATDITVSTFKCMRFDKTRYKRSEIFRLTQNCLTVAFK